MHLLVNWMQCAYGAGMREVVSRAHSTDEGTQPRGRLDSRLAAIGVVGGLLSGLLGVGGGVIMVPLLVVVARCGQRQAHALSLGAIIPISVAGLATFGAAGEVRPAEAAVLAAGSIVGARGGAALLARIDETVLKLIFGLVLVGVAATMAVRP